MTPQSRKTTRNPARNFQGETARKWRRGIGALAKQHDNGKTEKDARTRTFPLELPENAFDFAEAGRLFNVVEGVEAGSLAAFLCAAHLSGFRMCGGAGKAKKYRPDMKSGPTIARDDGRRLENMHPEDGDIWMHKTVAVVAKQARTDLKKNDVSGSEIKLRLLGGSAGAPHGLSWLFGAGWEWLSSDTSDEDIAKATDADIARVRQLREYARAVPSSPPFYKKKNYADFRVQAAQKLGSWIGNYWKRLAELRAQVENPPEIQLPPSLDDERLNTLLSRANITREEIRAAAAALPKMFANARGALDILAGRDKTLLPGRGETKTLDELNAAVDEFAGVLRTLKNFAEQRAERDDNLKFWKGLDGELQTALKPLDKLQKLNRISGGAPDAEREVRKTEDAFNALWRHCREQFAAIAGDAAGMRAILESAAEDEKKTLHERGRDESAAAEFAVRKQLQQIGNAARNMRGDNMEIVAAPVRKLFAKKKDANKYFNNRAGALYRSPYSRSVHNPYDVNWREAGKIDWIAELETAAARMEARLAENRAEDWRDWLECRMLAMFIRLRGLPKEMPREKISALADIPAEAKEHLRFYSALAAALRADSVPRGVVISGFNQLRSALRGLAFKVMRPSFIIRAVFHPVGQDELIYAPKETTKKGEWTPPKRHRAHYAESFAAMAETENERGEMRAPDAVKSLLHSRRRNGRGNARLTEGDRAALTQTPHDWLFPVKNWNMSAPERDGAAVCKSKSMQLPKGFGMLKPVAGARLVGPSSLKNALDDCLRGRVVLGESSLILEREYAQRFRWKNGTLSLSVPDSAATLRAKLAVPVMSELKPAAEENRAFYERFVAIDLGERGIGFAVFNVREWLVDGRDSPMISGTKPIPSIRALIRAVRRHRGRAQPGQKMRDSHSRALEKRRKNVVGDVCHAVDSLCAEYNAFPVLEGDVANLETGGNQLKLIYGSVLHRYKYSGTPAHKKQRGEHWFAGAKGGQWPHPYLIRVVAEGKGKKTKPLTLFPGTQVSAAGTSQECSVCRRNAPRILKNLPDNFSLHFRNGEANLAGGENLFPGESVAGALFLYEKTTKQDPRELRRLRRQKLRPELETPLNGVKKAGELRALVKFNLRRPPVSTRSKDTSQSRYFCVFAGCRNEMHADENAAINIGRRLLSDMDRERSREKDAKNSDA
ncbi:MAG: type V CRISPR-associated protein Cas12c [Gammaproteobacteria bacterium]